jgi:negative regulator of flagellin synthesis FlgM
MRISGKSSVSGSSPAGPSRTAPAAAAPAAGSSAPLEDAVSVSGSVQLIALAQAEVAKVPEVRTEKVEALRAAIDSDRYHPDGEAVADGIVREHTPNLAAGDVGT